MALEVSTGTCDLCGAISDATVQECNILACTFQHCEGGLYHQECLEKYLKANKLEKNRKTGFKCPRGCGKGTKWPEPCPGRIDKSHPIHPRNEDKKKTKLAAVVVEPQRPGKAAGQPAAANGKPGKGKEEAKVDAGKDAKGAAAKATPAATKAVPAAAAAAPAAKTLVVKKEPAVLPPRPEVVAKQKLAEQVALARRELGLAGSNTMPSTGSKGDLQGMVGAGSAKASAAASTSAASAWGGRPAAAAPEPAALQPTTLAQLPQFHQLIQQAVNKKTAAAAKAAAPTPAPPAAATPAKPAPAVPQPVLNPPTPVWPALGSVQTSAAALLSSASSATPTPREGSTRPASPPSAWGQAAAPAPATPAAAAASMPGPVAATSASTSPSLPLPPAGLARSGTTTPTPAPAPATTPAAATAPVAAPASAGSSAAAATLAGQAAGVAGSGLLTSASGRSLASSEQGGTSTAGSAAAVAATQRGQALVGAEYADEEVKETKLTKAQKKNLKRSEKKKLESGPEGDDCAAGEGDGAAGGSAADLRQTPGSTSAAAGGAAARRSGGGAASGSAAASHRRLASRGSDDPDQAADAEAAAVMEELCINSIVARKVLALIAQLQRLGAPEFVAAAAVQRHGSNVMSALEWLLVAGPDAAASTPEAVLAAAAESPSAAASEVDISEELQQLSDLQAAMGVPTELLQQCVVDCNGDVQAATNVALERLLAAPSGSAASLRGAAGNSRSGSPAVRGSGSGAMQLQPSASFYSVSSLDGSAAEAAAVAAAAAAKPRSHFGVRLQEDPAEGAGGLGAGYGGYGSALLQGGVVLGASGWANGYGATADAATGNGAVAGSRLSRWLRDDSGRCVGQDEDGAGATGGASGVNRGLRNGLLSPADPVLESPFAAHSDMARGLAGAGKAAAGASESPSLGSWLSSNGYHHSMGLGGHGIGHGGEPSGTGHFSFVSALSKPTASMAAGGGLEPLAEYGSRWSSQLATPAHHLAPPGFGGRGAGAGASEAESAPHNDVGGEGELGSLMGLINGR
ncbi:hypothetical protein HYH02_009495 [Chlamydomonas schloesseri]|uniref:UBA domain-containing protein n=1 Tax=Chlamydomonas schloesseri TaxID=2026947 RepID=A0A835W9Y3_9CHLO|nr:hypothetical protein HYH02_009495 [Chlamydomonas schloesseri]|eukprot:KAG2443081.1 hypothetical protein HYH02_009495 [Chlamydomonas schloesseri]